MDKIFIKGLRIQAILGINDWERKNKQDVLIYIELCTDTRQAAQTDNINDCVNYETITQKIRTQVKSAKRFTVEALANDIARLCLAEPRVHKVQVRVEKPGGVTGSSSVGIEIERELKNL